MGIGHTKVKLVWLALVLTGTGGTGPMQQPCPRPLWTEDLIARYQFHDFGDVKHPRNQLPPLWTRERGVVFILPNALAVYQVRERNDLPPLEPRNEAGGGGRYLIQVVLFDTSDGKNLGTIRLTTSVLAPSGVYPTHDGNFLVRAADILRLYSPKLEELAFKSLPHSDAVSHQTTVISVSPSGKQVFVEYRPSTVRDVLDADTLRLLPSSQGIDSDGQVNAKAFNFVAKDTSCPSGRGRLTPELFVGYGCKELKVLSYDGRLLWDVPMSEQVVRVLGNETRLVAEIQHHRANPFDLDLAPKLLGLIIYDLPSKTERCRIPVQSKAPAGEYPAIYFGLSKTGGIAVVQENELSFYNP